MKKLFIISSVLFVFALLLWGIYFLAFRTPAPENITLQEDVITPTVTEDVDIVDDILYPLTEVDVITAEKSLTGDNIRYLTSDGRAFTMTERGTNHTELFSLPHNTITKAFWSPYYDDLVLLTDTGVFTYNNTLGESVALKPTVDYATWSDLSGKILYKYFDDATRARSLNIANARGSDWRELAPLPYRRASFMQIPRSSYIAFWQDGDSFTQTRLETINALTPNTPTLVYEGLYGADFLYAPDGKNILVSSVVNRGGADITLALMNEDGGLYTNLGIPTIVQKTVWSKDNETVYYAQPSDIPGGSVMPNDYKQKRFTTRDSFWKINTTTGEKQRLIDLSDVTEKIDATQLFLSEAEDALFFINRINGLLYRLDFK